MNFTHGRIKSRKSATFFVGHCPGGTYAYFQGSRDQFSLSTEVLECVCVCVCVCVGVRERELGIVHLTTNVVLLILPDVR